MPTKKLAEPCSLKMAARTLIAVSRHTYHWAINKSSGLANQHCQGTAPKQKFKPKIQGTASIPASSTQDQARITSRTNHPFAKIGLVGNNVVLLTFSRVRGSPNYLPFQKFKNSKIAIYERIIKFENVNEKDRESSESSSFEQWTSNSSEEINFIFLIKIKHRPWRREQRKHV